MIEVEGDEYKTDEGVLRERTITEFVPDEEDADANKEQFFVLRGAGLDELSGNQRYRMSIALNEWMENYLSGVLGIHDDVAVTYCDSMTLEETVNDMHDDPFGY